MVNSEYSLRWPTSDELPGSDETPVDDELQNLVPNLLGWSLSSLWQNRWDWFFGVDMGIYFRSSWANPRSPLVPDGFLSLGVDRVKGNRLRKSYFVWEEKDIIPTLVLEVVSEKYGGEYHEKMNKYARLGVLYYAIYNPEFFARHNEQPFEVYKLVNKTYRLQLAEPFWMPEIGLGIGRGTGTYWGLTQEWLFWYDEQGNRYLTPEETALAEQQQRLEISQQVAEMSQTMTEMSQLLARYREQFGELP